MLILTRAKDESIIVDNHIEIIVVDIRDDKVRLGIKAPKSMPVHRKEIQDAIIKERQSCGVGNKRILSGQVGSL